MWLFDRFEVELGCLIGIEIEVGCLKGIEIDVGCLTGIEIAVGCLTGFETEFTSRHCNNHFEIVCQTTTLSNLVSGIEFSGNHIVNK